MTGGIILTVSELTRHIKSLIGDDPLLQDLWVKGEISNFQRHDSGHLYFSLKDEGAIVDCVMWRERAAKLQFEPRDGLGVVARGYVSVYEKRGRYQFYVQDMLPLGVGLLWLRLEELKRKLEAEGLFNRKRPLPKYPERIALVTSPVGAAVRDLISIITRRFPPARIVVVPTLVQGREAPSSIARAIELANRAGVDIIIVARGGGSFEELYAFNEEIVARAIYASERPVVSAVGHEVDFTIADLVADRRAPTPSAAAEIAVPDRTELMAQLAQIRGRLLDSARRRIEVARGRLTLLAERRPLQRPKTALDQRRQRLDELRERLKRVAVAGLVARFERLARLRGVIEAMDPRRVLRRGYAILRKANGRIVRSPREVSAGEELEAKVAQGSFKVRVE
ncbi:MAG TPA: exodeoxyribonuclease VII large subunit [Armatimonadetes bacterium]|nr:exodeoxyribonuclease VII large subunit [Armatimonadota bacterium]